MNRYCKSDCAEILSHFLCLLCRISGILPPHLLWPDWLTSPSPWTTSAVACQTAALWPTSPMATWWICRGRRLQVHPLPLLLPRPQRGGSPRASRVRPRARAQAQAQARVQARAQVQAPAPAQAGVLAEVWFRVVESVVGAQTRAVAVVVETVAESLAAVAGAVVVSRPHSAASPLLPSLPPPKTSLEEGHRCRKEEKTQSEVAAASVLSSDLFSRLPGLVVRSWPFIYFFLKIFVWSHSICYQVCAGPVHLSTCSVLSASLLCRDTDRQWDDVKTEQNSWQNHSVREWIKDQEIIYFKNLRERKCEKRRTLTANSDTHPTHTHTDMGDSHAANVSMPFRPCVCLCMCELLQSHTHNRRVFISVLAC